MRGGLRRTILFLLMLLLATPRTSHAVPIWDWNTTKHHITNFASMLADYEVLKRWRDEMLAKAEWADLKAREKLLERRRLERQALGELGAIGKAVPNWEQFTNVCRYEFDVAGREVSVCNIERVTEREINRLVELVTNEIEQAILGASSVIEEEVDQVIGTSYSGFIAFLSQAGAHPLNELAEYHVTQAEAANNLVAMAEHLNLLVDSLMVIENLEEMVSSGRANQIVANIGIIETGADLELTRQRIQQLRVTTIETMDRMYGLRRDEQRNAPGFSAF